MSTTNLSSTTPAPSSFVVGPSADNNSTTAKFVDRRKGGDTGNHRTGSIRYQGSERFFLEMPYGDHFIWGVTAGMISVMRNRIFPE